ncbi:MAG: Uma2 family endonuclease [Vulcanimicrobiaceae bacterium]
MTAQPHGPLTLAEFPAWELRQQAKHEFVDGHVYGFVGGTIEHNAISVFLIEKIAPAARPCRTYGSDMLIATFSSSRYADLALTCDERDRAAGATIIRYPKLIVEVLSPSTASDDLGPKMREYQTIETLEEYLTLDSRRRWAQVLRRTGTDWLLAAPLTRGALEIASVGTTLDLDQLYRDCGL